MSLLKEVLDQMKGGSKAKKDSLLALEQKNEVDYQKLRGEVVSENQQYTLTTNNSSGAGNATESTPATTTKVAGKLFPTAKYTAMDSTEKAAKFEVLVDQILALYQGIDWEKIRFDQIEAYLQDPAKFTVLLNSIKKNLEALGKDIVDDLLKNNVTVIKGKIKTQVKKIIDDLVKEFYDKETKK